MHSITFLFNLRNFSKERKLSRSILNETNQIFDAGAEGKHRTVYLRSVPLLK